jgi:hypothetical protein
MFSMFARLAPATLFGIGLAVGAIPAGAAGWLTRGAMFDWFERPAIIRTQEEILTREVEAAAKSARADEQMRIFRAGEYATQQHLQSSEAAEDDRRAELDMLQLEIERYAAALTESDHVCIVDGADLDFLGLQHNPAGAPQRSR